MKNEWTTVRSKCAEKKPGVDQQPKIEKNYALEAREWSHEIQQHLTLGMSGVHLETDAAQAEKHDTLLQQTSHPLAMVTVKPQKRAGQVTPVTFTLHQTVAGETKKKVVQGYLNNYYAELISFRGGVATLQRAPTGSSTCVVKVVAARNVLQAEEWQSWKAVQSVGDLNRHLQKLEPPLVAQDLFRSVMKSVSLT